MTKIIILFLSTSLTGINAPIGILGAPVTMLLSDKMADTVLCESLDSTDCKETKKAEVVEKTPEEIVKDYFSDAPIMAEIARCESSFRQFDGSSILRGVQNNKDVGIMQINEYFHLERAQKLNLDIYSLEGNLAFARYLFEKQGTRPWKASEKCWGRNT